jgi:4,5-DOPA dioxygenase extradiol
LLIPVEDPIPMTTVSSQDSRFGSRIPAAAYPAGAYDDHLARVLPQAREQRLWSPADGPVPSLFVSHGAPFTLDDPQWIGELFDWAQSMPKPKAVIVVSAHWEHAQAAISGTAAGTPLYYDFSGFHPRYKTLPYATPDATDLARRLAGLLGRAPVHEFTDRGLDHGAFIPLMAMYPAADIPVVQLSMPGLDPGALFELGTRLRPLRDEGILVLGSGFMTHSFAVFRSPALAAHTAAFDEWAVEALARADIDALTDYRSKAPGAEIAHPTAEHFVPLLLTVGAAADPGSAVSAIDRMVMGNSTRSVQMN